MRHRLTVRLAARLIATATLVAVPAASHAAAWAQPAGQSLLPAPAKVVARTYVDPAGDVASAPNGPHRHPSLEGVDIAEVTYSLDPSSKRVYVKAHVKDLVQLSGAFTYHYKFYLNSRNPDEVRGVGVVVDTNTDEKHQVHTDGCKAATAAYSTTADTVTASVPLSCVHDWASFQPIFFATVGPTAHADSDYYYDVSPTGPWWRPSGR